MTAHHILVPIDFSPYADHALNYAIELATKLQADLTLLHVVDTMSWGVAHAESMIPPEVWQELQTGIEESMETFCDRVQDADLKGESLITRGAPFDIIINTAKDRGADLIIMGTHGRTGLTHVLMGSVAEKVVRLAPCPVLVTRGMTEASTD